MKNQGFQAIFLKFLELKDPFLKNLKHVCRNLQVIEWLYLLDVLFEQFVE